MEYQFTEGVQYQNDVVVGPEIQERISRFMDRKNKSRNFIKAFFSGIWTGINWILIGLGAAAISSLVLAFIFPDQAGNVIAWLIAAGMDWARGLK